MSYRKKGFTLIELLIVVAIIALLASIVLVGLGGFRRSGRDGRRIADIRQVQNALELYFNRCSIYPGTGCDETLADPADWTALEAELIAIGIGVTKIPHDPLFSGGYADYGYLVSNDNFQYVARATLETDGHQALNGDTDGTIGAGNFDCEDVNRQYCVTSEQ